MSTLHKRSQERSRLYGVATIISIAISKMLLHMILNSYCARQPNAQRSSDSCVRWESAWAFLPPMPRNRNGWRATFGMARADSAPGDESGFEKSSLLIRRTNPCREGWLMLGILINGGTRSSSKGVGYCWGEYLFNYLGKTRALVISHFRVRWLMS